MFISNILSACRQVTNMLQQKKICSYLMYSQHVDKSQICYSKRKYVHIKYTLSMESSHKYVIAKENMFNICNILSACRQVTNMLQQKKICSYQIYTQPVDKSQICYRNENMFMQTSHKYVIAKENMFISNILSAMQTSHRYVVAKENMFISNILSACRLVTNMLQQKKICSYLIYSQHADMSQICYSKRNMFISNILSACRQVTNMLQQKKKCSYIIYSSDVDKLQICYSKQKICSYLIYSQHVESSHKYVIAERKYVHI